MKLDTILVPTDFSADATKAISTAADLAKLFDAKVVVLHAYHVELPMATPMGEPRALPQGFYEEMRQQATEQVQKVAAELVAQGVDASGVAVFEPASLSIVSRAESLPADLIVMGTRGRTGLKHILLGSVAERVVRTASCPVLTVKADA